MIYKATLTEERKIKFFYVKVMQKNIAIASRIADGLTDVENKGDCRNFFGVD